LDANRLNFIYEVCTTTVEKSDLQLFNVDEAAFGVRCVVAFLVAWIIGLINVMLGSRFGLSLTLNIEQYEYMKGPQNDAGIKVVNQLCLSPKGDHVFTHVCQLFDSVV